MIDKIRKVMRGEKGFTLVEMMVVLIIIAVLIGLGIRMYIGYIAGAKVTKAKGDMATLSAALDSYYATNQAYPSSYDTGLVLAGLSTAEVGSSGTTGRLYTITTSGTPGYEIYTTTPPDGTNYVIATGAKGVTAQSPITTISTSSPGCP
jgi:prepilin-type N-terminal cleavage/methylation domain-containing protein